MKNKHFISFISSMLLGFLLFVSLSACRDGMNFSYQDNSPTSIKSEQALVENEESSTSVVCEEEKVTYILNTNSHKIHKLTCGTGDLIIPENRKVYKGNIEDLYNQGYTKCGNCFRGEK